LETSIKEAESLVGYTTTFNSWKYLFEEEPATFIGLARKIVGTGHPLLQTARDILSQDPHSSSHLGGLWVLLLSKAAGVNKHFDVSSNVVQGIHVKQRLLAETTELINTAFLIHRNMVETENNDAYNVAEKKTLEFSNKLFILGGDFLLSKASLELAKIENTDVVALIGKSIGDMSEGNSFELDARDVTTWSVNTWEEYIYLIKGSLMANSCRSTAKIVQHADAETLGGAAFDFGRNLVLAQHCSDDIKNFLDEKQMVKRTNYIVIKGLEGSGDVGDFIREHGDEVWVNVALNKRLKSCIQSSHGGDVVAGARADCERYTKACLDSISDFPERDTVKKIGSILKNISSVES